MNKGLHLLLLNIYVIYNFRKLNFTKSNVKDWQKIHLKSDKIFIKQSISIFFQFSFSDLVKFGPIFGILDKTLESSLYCKGIKRVNPKGNQP